MRTSSSFASVFTVHGISELSCGTLVTMLRVLSQLASVVPRQAVFCVQTSRQFQTLLSSCVSKLYKPSVAKEQTQWAAVCLQSVRGKIIKHYTPSAWKRINKHGIHKRLCSESGIHMIWRRKLKGRQNFAPYQRLIPGSKDGRIIV